MVDADIWGRILRDHERGRAARFIVRREDGRLEEDAPDYYFAPYAQWLPCERRALGHVAGPALDLGCGAGRVALRLQEEGIPVLGVDRSPGALAVARRRGVRATHLGEVRAGNLPDGEFRTAVLLGNNLGIAGDLQATEDLLRSLRERLGREGRVVFSTCDPVGLSAGGLALYPRRRQREGRYMGEFRIRIEYRGLTGPWFGLVFFDRRTLERSGRASGWRVAAVYPCGPGAEGFYAGVLEAA